MVPLSDANTWRFSCCNRLYNAIAEEPMARLQITVTKRKNIRYYKKYFVASVYDKDGKLLAACRHEIDPFLHHKGDQAAIVASLTIALIG